MRYVHNLACLGGIKTPDGRFMILYYREPGEEIGANQTILRNLKDPVEIVESSQFGLIHPNNIERSALEK